CRSMVYRRLTPRLTASNDALSHWRAPRGEVTRQAPAPWWLCGAATRALGPFGGWRATYRPLAPSAPIIGQVQARRPAAGVGGARHAFAYSFNWMLFWGLAPAFF